MNAAALLRPLSAGDLLDEAVWLYRKNFLRFILLVGLLRVPFTLLVGLFRGVRDSVPFALTPLNLLSLAMHHLLLATLFSALFAYAVTSALDGRVLSPSQAYLATARRFVTLLANAVVANIAYSLVIAAATLGFQFTRVNLLDPLTGVTAPWAFALIANLIVYGGYALCVALPLLYLDARWSVSQQVIALENRGAVQALGRSAQLVHGQYLRVMFFLLGLFLLGSLLSTAPSFLSEVIAESISPTYERATWAGIAYLFFGFAVPTLLDLLFLPVSFVARALLYYDLRVRAEGYDLSVRVAHWAEQAA